MAVRVLKSARLSRSLHIVHVGAMEFGSYNGLIDIDLNEFK